MAAVFRQNRNEITDQILFSLAMIIRFLWQWMKYNLIAIQRNCSYSDTPQHLTLVTIDGKQISWDWISSVSFFRTANESGVINENKRNILFHNSWKPGTSVVSITSSGARAPWFDPHSGRGKFRCPNTLGPNKHGLVTYIQVNVFIGNMLSWLNGDWAFKTDVCWRFNYHFSVFSLHIFEFSSKSNG